MNKTLDDKIIHKVDNIISALTHALARAPHAADVVRHRGLLLLSSKQLRDLRSLLALALQGNNRPVGRGFYRVHEFDD